MAKLNVCVAMTLLLAAGPAGAQERLTEEDAARDISITTNLVNLADLVITRPRTLFIDVMGEAVIRGRFSFAGDVGLGRQVGQGAEPVGLFALAAQARYRVHGTAQNGLQVGIHLGLRSQSQPAAQQSGLSFQRSDLDIGSFLGFKHVASFGLTLDAQVGFAFGARVFDTYQANTSSDLRLITLLPLVRLAVGWSF